MLSEIIRKLVPDAEFTFSGEPSNANEYHEKFVWLDDRTQPTWDQIEEIRPLVERERAKEQAETNRADAYRAEADPLYFGWQRGENTEQVWLDKVAEIRARYPYPA